jgi:signal transduction histidine kinase
MWYSAIGMAVDFDDILHVLAHELRTPVGIAHGYVRLLLDDRLPNEADRRRALEQMQKALGRLSHLSHETTALAEWYEQDATPQERLAASALIARVAETDFEFPITVDTSAVPDSVDVPTHDPDALVRAVIGVVQATARELRGVTCDVVARIAGNRFELLVGPEEMIDVIAEGPNAPTAGPVALERGGLGLVLVHAAVVLDGHGAERWAMNGSRQAIGLRLPLEER